MDSKWEPIKPLDPGVEENLSGDLAALDRLHPSWQDFADSLGENSLQRELGEPDPRPEPSTVTEMAI